MRVVCTNDEGWHIIHYSGQPITNLPVKDGLYTVVDEMEFQGYNYYALKECDGYYFKPCFVPLDEYLDQFTGVLTKELEKQELIII